MIDLRSHILHGVSCGPKSFDESLAMARSAISAGVKTVVATPLWRSGSMEPPMAFDDCYKKLSDLEFAMANALSIKLGFTIQFFEGIADLVCKYGAEVSLGGNGHLLISLPSLRIPQTAEIVWDDLKALGFAVLLAHPECNPAIRKDISRLGRWVSFGVSLQLDAASVTGIYGREIKRFSVDCLRKFGNSCVLASNARPGTTSDSALVRARSEIEAKVSPYQAGKSIFSIPSEILGSQEKSGVPKGNLSRNNEKLSTSNGNLRSRIYQ